MSDSYLRPASQILLICHTIYDCLQYGDWRPSKQHQKVKSQTESYKIHRRSGCCWVSISCNNVVKTAL